MADIIIIGAGTAGLTAAIYVQRAGKQALVLEGNMPGGQIVNTMDVENYPGIAHISGYDFANGLYEQAMALGAQVEFESVKRVEDHGKDAQQGKRFTVRTDANEYEAVAIILATGVTRRELGIEKEKELTGKGVSYCATCDGAFYRGKTVAVNGGGNTAVEDAQFLTNFCEKVYLIHRRDAFRADSAEVEKLKTKENIEFVLDSTISGLQADKESGKLSGIEVKNVKTGENRTLDLAGLFVAIGQIPSNRAFADLVELDDTGYIVAGEDCKTSHDGIFAAGDCRTKKVRQLTTAAADGSTAALAAVALIP